jgi:hypothetical protein
MVALLPAEHVDRAIEILAGRGVPAWAAGEVSLDDEHGGEVLMAGRHPGW